MHRYRHRNFAFESLEKRECFSASTGLQFVGLSSTTIDPATHSTPNNAAAVATLVKQSGVKDVEINSLPFEFSSARSHQFDNLSTFVKQALPSIPGQLKIDLDLEWFPHTVPSGVKAQDQFWAAWQAWKDPKTGKNLQTPAQKKLTDDFLSRVRDADAWVRGIQTWARHQGLANRLQITLVPVLEDTDSSLAAYTNIVTAMRSQISQDGLANVNLRRSSVPEKAFRVPGTSLELHGPWAVVGKQLLPGDVWSNDGVTKQANGKTLYTFANFKADEQSALKAGVSALYWSASFNGTPNGAGNEYNEAQRVVTPFTGVSKALEMHQVTDALRGKPA